MNSLWNARGTPSSLSFFGDFNIAKTVSRAKRVPISERKLRAWYKLRRNLRLYDILFFCEAHCITL